MIGGLTTSFLGELLVYPVLFWFAKRVVMHREFHRGGDPALDPAAA
jgi:hypothetical protein